VVLDQFAKWPEGLVVCGLAKTALPLARLLSVKSWVAVAQSGVTVAQLTQVGGERQLLSVLYDRLGWVQASKGVEDELKRGARSETSGPVSVSNAIETERHEPTLQVVAPPTFEKNEPGSGERRE
jgi:hypothetical protein